MIYLMVNIKSFGRKNYMTDIIMQAYHVLDEIKSDSVYQSIKTMDHLITQKYKDEIKRFRDANIAYDNIMSEGGTYHPDYKETVKIFINAKSDLYQKPEVIQYFEFERQFQEQLNLFLTSLSQSVSNHIASPIKWG